MVKHVTLFLCSELINNKISLLQSDDYLLSFIGSTSQCWMWPELQFNPHRNSKLLKLNIATRLVLIIALLAAKQKQLAVLIWHSDEAPVSHYRGFPDKKHCSLGNNLWKISYPVSHTSHKSNSHRLQQAGFKSSALKKCLTFLRVAATYIFLKLHPSK